MLSPLYPPVVLPMPATVFIIPSTVTLRMTLLPKSEKYTLPEASKLIPIAPLIVALIAGPVSPLYPVAPVPTKVVIILVDAVTLRTLKFPESQMKVLPRNIDSVNL